MICSGVSWVSKPSGISDLSEATISSMSSRRTTCRLASLSISSRAVCGLGGEQAVQDAAVGGGDGVLAEVALDRAVRVEDLGEELLLRVDGEAGQVRRDVGPHLAVAVAGGADRLEHLAAPLGVAGLLGQREELVEDRLPVGAGEPAALREQLAGPSGDRPVRVAAEPLGLRGAEVAGGDRPGGDAVEQRAGPLRPPQEHVERLLTEGRGEPSPAVDQRRAEVGGVGLRGGVEQAGGQFGGRAGRDLLEHPVERVAVRGELDEPSRGGDAGRGVRVGIGHRGGEPVAQARPSPSANRSPRPQRRRQGRQVRADRPGRADPSGRPALS